MNEALSFNNATSFYDFLRSAINDRGLASLNRIAKLAATERDLDIKGPCVAALACWGDAGFVMMIENALRNRTSKDTSAAIKTLALIAAGKPISSVSTFIIDQSMLDLINAALAEMNLTTVARKRLAELVMSLPTDDPLIPLGTTFTQVSFGDADVAAEIVAAISTKWLGFGSHELERFEKLLETCAEDEFSLHAFLEEFPQMLDPMAVQVWSKPDFHGFKEPDFLIRRSDNSYIVVEIENAEKPIMTQAAQPTAYATQAIKQANDYRAFILERLTEARSHFPHIYDPDCLVVIGLERSLTPSQAKALQQENYSRSKLRVVGFDWILHRSRAVISNVTASKVQVIKNYRVI